MIAGDLDVGFALADGRGVFLLGVLGLFVSRGGKTAAHEVAGLAADGLDVESSPRASVDELAAALTMFELNAPANPLSPEMTTSRTFFFARHEQRVRHSPVGS